jgi:hypothetical protein
MVRRLLHNVQNKPSLFDLWGLKAMTTNQEYFTLAQQGMREISAQYPEEAWVDASEVDALLERILGSLAHDPQVRSAALEFLHYYEAPDESTVGLEFQEQAVAVVSDLESAPRPWVKPGNVRSTGFKIFAAFVTGILSAGAAIGTQQPLRIAGQSPDQKRLAETDALTATGTLILEHMEHDSAPVAELYSK